MDYLKREHSPTMDIFDQAFSSGFAGMRKPDLDFFRWVIEKSQLVSGRTIFVDDKIENVYAARKVGLYGVWFEGTDALCDRLRGLILSV